MNLSSHQRTITTVTLLAAAAAVAVMAVWGVNAATAPVDTAGGPSTKATGPDCPVEDQVIKEFITRGEVTVSVYNTGARKGRAGDTLTMLEDAGFNPGAIGNADATDKVRRAEVRTTKQDDAGARLVARSMGRGTQVVVTDQDYGPGVDVFIGDKFGGLNNEARLREPMSEPITRCR